MNYIITQIVGVALIVLGGQGGLRLLANENEPGLLAGLPGDISLKLAVYIAIVIAGATLVAWVRKKSRLSVK